MRKSLNANMNITNDSVRTLWTSYQGNRNLSPDPADFEKPQGLSQLRLSGCRWEVKIPGGHEGCANVKSGKGHRAFFLKKKNSSGCCDAQTRLKGAKETVKWTFRSGFPLIHLPPPPSLTHIVRQSQKSTAVRPPDASVRTVWISKNTTHGRSLHVHVVTALAPFVTAARVAEDTHDSGWASQSERDRKSLWLTCLMSL